MDQKRGPIVVVAAALAIVYVAWGSTYVAMKISVRDLPPISLSAARFLLAGGLLYGWCAWRRHRRPGTDWRSPTAAQWRVGAILGLLLPAAGTGGATWAEQKLPAGTAALLLATIPVWMVIGSRITKQEPLTARTSLGLGAGLVGVAVLIDPFSSHPPNALACTVALLGAMCWGFGSVYAVHAARPAQPLLGAAIQMVSAGVALALVALVSGEASRVHLNAIFGPSGAAVAYLVVVGSLVAYSTYEWLLQHAPSRIVGTYAFVNPLVAVLLGWWLLSEPLSARAAEATSITLVGVVLIVLRQSHSKSSRATEHLNSR